MRRVYNTLKVTEAIKNCPGENRPLQFEHLDLQPLLPLGCMDNGLCFSRNKDKSPKIRDIAE